MVSSRWNERKGGISVKYGWKSVLVFVVLVALMLIYRAVTHTFMLFEAVLAILCLLLMAEEQYRISQKKKSKVADIVSVVAACLLFLLWVVYRMNFRAS